MQEDDQAAYDIFFHGEHKLRWKFWWNFKNAQANLDESWHMR